MAVKQSPQELMAAVNKLVPGAVRMASDTSLKQGVLSTGVLPIDYMLRGGLPRGRSVEIFGDYSTLKSFIVLCSIASVQRSGGVAALIDTEHAMDQDWALALGVNLDDLIYQKPDNGEVAVDTAELLLRSGDVDLVAFDSVAAILPRSEQEIKLSGPKSVQPARLAALMSLTLRKLTTANTGRTAILWINQTRVNVGVTFGSPEVVTGGKSLPFYASWRLSLRKAGRVTEDAKVYDGKEEKTVKMTTHQRIRAFTEKSKLDKPYKECYFDFDLNTGRVDDLGFMVSLGLEQGVITKNGAMWTLRGESPVRGADNFKKTVDPTKLASKLSLNGAVFKGSGGEPPALSKPAATTRKLRSKSLAPARTRTAVRGE